MDVLNAKLLGILLFLFSVLITSPVQAAVITYGPGIFQGDTLLDRQTSLPKFDPSLGTLTGVSAEVQVVFSGVTALVVNSVYIPDAYGNPMPSSNWYQTTLFETGVTGPGGLGFIVYSTASGAGYLPYGESQVQMISTSSHNSGSASGLSAYIGSGSVTLDIDAPILAGTRVVGSAPGQVIRSAYMTGHALITYEYEVVSEPVTALLFLLGLGPLALASFRRQRVDRLKC